MSLPDTKALVRSAANAIVEGRFSDALAELSTLPANAPRSSLYYKAVTQAELGLYRENFVRDGLFRARDAAVEGQKHAKPKTAVALGLLECEILGFLGEYKSSADKYQSFFLEYPTYVEGTNVRLKAAQAYRRCDLVEECLSLLQDLMDYPPAPYDETDVLLMLSVCYEYTGTSDGKRMSKEALKHAYKKAREAGRVKSVEDDDNGNEPRTANPDNGQPQFELALMVGQQRPIKHVSFTEWKNDPDTWTEIADRCKTAADLVFSLDFFTKALWTESGQQDPNLWIQFSELSFLMGEAEPAVQALATVYYMRPFDLEIRCKLGLWDPAGWGAHIALEESTITKVQAIIRGRWGRRYAAAHKERVLIERARRKAAAIEIQRTVARGVQGRTKAQRRREQLAAEWAAYQRFLLETASAETLQRSWRCYSARRELLRRRIAFHASRTIQCAVRSFFARKELAYLRRTYMERMRARGATQMQKVCRGWKGRKRAAVAKKRRDAARNIQRVWRGAQARKSFRYNLDRFRGAREMQKIARGYAKRKWYKNLRVVSITKIQTSFRAYLCRKSFPGFKRGIGRYRKLHQETKSPFASVLEYLSVHLPASQIALQNASKQSERKSSFAPQDQSALSASHETPRPSSAQTTAEHEGKEKSHHAERPGSAPSTAAEKDNVDSAVSKHEGFIKVTPVAAVDQQNRKRSVDCDEIETDDSHRSTQNPPKAEGRSAQVFVNAFFQEQFKDKHAAGEMLRSWLLAHKRQAECIWTQNFPLGPAGMGGIAEILRENDSVTEIGFGVGSDLGVQGTTELAETMRCHNFRFRRLMINDQPKLQDEGVMPLMKTVGDFFFGRYSHLEEISLRNTGLGDTAVIALVEGLELNTKLKRLHLEQNRIRDAGAAALGAIFPRNETLQDIDLGDNHIGSEGASKLAYAIRHATLKGARGLQFLILDANLITTQGAVAILRCLHTSHKHRRSLQITAAANPFGPDLHVKIRDLNLAVGSGQGLPRVRASFLQAHDAHAMPQDPADPGDDEPRIKIVGPPFPRPDLPPVKLNSSNPKTSPYLARPWARPTLQTNPYR